MRAEAFGIGVALARAHIAVAFSSPITTWALGKLAAANTLALVSCVAMALARFFAALLARRLDGWDIALRRGDVHGDQCST